MAYSLDGIVTDTSSVPVAGAKVYVYDNTGTLADLFDANGGSTPNPLTTDALGYFQGFVAVSGYYTVKYHYAGKIRYVDANKLIGDAVGILLDDVVDTLARRDQCLIIPILGQSLTIARAPTITTPANMPQRLYMPVGGPDWPAVNNPAPLDVNARPVVPTNFASFGPWVQSSNTEGLAPGLAWQLEQAGYGAILPWAPGVGGSSLGSHLAGGTNAGASGPYFANCQAFLRAAVKWARARNLEPVIVPVYNAGHADADLLNDGGAAGTETSQAAYVAGLTKLYRDFSKACMIALGEPWAGSLWITPLITGQGSSQYTLTGRKQVVAAQLQAANGGVPGVRLLPPYSQFAAIFETDLIHPGGQAFRYYGEVIGAVLTQALAGTTRTVPYMTAKSVLSSTQVKVTFSEPVEINAGLIEATTAGVKAGLEAYTAGGTQIPLTAAEQGGANEIIVTMANTGTFSVIRNGLAQENTGVATLMPRTRIASPTALGEAQDGTALYLFSTPQEI